MKNYDVVIAGAGMAGMTLALALKQGGLDVALVERQSFDDILDVAYDGRASAIAYACFRQWQALGVGQVLEHHACRMDEIVVSDGHLPGAASPKPLPFFLHFTASEISDSTGDEPLGYMVENRQTRKALYEAITQSGVDLFSPVSVSDSRETASMAEIELDTGEVLRAPLIVSAEGRRSSLRDKAGIHHIHWNYDQSAVVCTVKMEKPPVSRSANASLLERGHVAYEHFLPTGPFAILPLTGNRACIVWSEKHAKAKALMSVRPELFHAHLMARFGDFLGEVELIGDKFIYPLGLGLAQEMHKGRLALVGDSAHGIHPIAGQGLNLGLKDVAALAEVLIEAARLGEDLGSDLVLERYAKWRRFDNVSTAAIMDGFVRLFSTGNPLVRTVRDVGMGIFNRVPALRTFVMEDAGAATGDLPRLLKGENV
ncbi:UbiH/UbiF/VisC/COQ6 family ubiquinone biosynthesis hydroxylase [Asticcacaulis sp. EMRT-3]|uniref:UbiH/UbiF/VisC/COQ6 family ubiquinone biosynthesis hydroxylase n=1 Tax=Asticcacaulis sp. EMRT-3 TaxID=3040349 RepID=UPI0024AFD597|nr:UbiH/UbiF/VisC/COQ6 family ubiquinone biosynthesis hydroxylase [Asticcacaulis sp. EMRT-3]MDI7775795.1 UbiH/UbiF/VisC/COQ6 family ubiquinone biosynthesis hydroxylase [Asticcacaulis sp. EMRT-3]